MGRGAAAIRAPRKNSCSYKRGPRPVSFSTQRAAKHDSKKAHPLYNTKKIKGSGVITDTYIASIESSIMARRSQFFVATTLAVMTLLASTTASAQSTAHKNPKGKANVAAVCAATKSAWSSTSSCNALKTGICDTIPTCSAATVCPFFISNAGGCNLVTQTSLSTQLGAYVQGDDACTATGACGFATKTELGDYVQTADACTAAGGCGFATVAALDGYVQTTDACTATGACGFATQTGVNTALANYELKTSLCDDVGNCPVVFELVVKTQMLENQVNFLDSEVNNLNSLVNNLDSQVNNLNAQVNNLNARVTALENP